MTVISRSGSSGQRRARQPYLLGDRLAQRRRAPGDGVLVHVGLDGRAGGVLERLGRREVGEPLGQVDAVGGHAKPRHEPNDRLLELLGLAAIRGCTGPPLVMESRPSPTRLASAHIGSISTFARPSIPRHAPRRSRSAARYNPAAGHAGRRRAVGDRLGLRVLGVEALDWSGRGGRYVTADRGANTLLEARLVRRTRRRRWRRGSPRVSPPLPPCSRRSSPSWSCSRTSTPHRGIPESALLMAHMRGVLCLAVHQYGVPLRSLTASTVKQRITGQGRARRRSRCAAWSFSSVACRPSACAPT